MRTTATLTLVAALLSSGEANAQSLQLLTSAEVAARPAAGGRIGVEIRSGRLPKTGAFYAEVVEVKEQSSFIGRLKPGDHILGVQSYSFGNMDDMITYLGSLPPKSSVQLLVSDAQDEKLRVVKGRVIGENQLSTSISATVASEADSYVPKDLDPKNRYQTYSFDEFMDLFNRTIGISNILVGKRVKIFALYAPTAATNSLNRTRRRFFKSYGCLDDICNTFEPLLSRNTIPKGKMGNFLMINFTDTQKYAAFIGDTNKLCKPDYGCYIWVAGIVKHVKVNVDSIIGVKAVDVAYLDPTEIRLYENGDSISIQVAKDIAPFILKLYSFSRQQQ